MRGQNLSHSRYRTQKLLRLWNIYKEKLGSEKSQPKGETMWFIGSKVPGTHIILFSPPDSRYRVAKI